jgi:hypothetical protein
MVWQVLEKTSPDVKDCVLVSLCSPVHFIRRLGEYGGDGTGGQCNVHLQAVAAQNLADLLYFIVAPCAQDHPPSFAVGIMRCLLAPEPTLVVGIFVQPASYHPSGHLHQYAP